MTSNKSSFSGMTKITYALGFGFILVFVIEAVITKQYSSTNKLDEIQMSVIDDSGSKFQKCLSVKLIFVTGGVIIT